MAKRKEVLKYKYKANVTVDKKDVAVDVKKSKEIHILEQGRMSDGTEFVTVKIFV
jgi:hypothetical protein